LGKKIDLERHAISVNELENPMLRALVKDRARIVWGLDAKSKEPTVFHGMGFIKDIIAGRAAEFDTRLAFAGPKSLARYFARGKEGSSWTIDPEYWDYFRLEEDGNLVPRSPHVPLAFVFALDWETNEPQYLSDTLKALKGDFDVRTLACR